MDENLQPFGIRDGDFAPVAFAAKNFDDKMFFEDAHGGTFVRSFCAEIRVHQDSAAFQIFRCHIAFDDGLRIDLIPLA